MKFGEFINLEYNPSRFEERDGIFATIPHALQRMRRDPEKSHTATQDFHGGKIISKMMKRIF